MSTIDDGGPAFPFGVRREIGDSYGGGEPYVTEANEPGMTLRDYVATHIAPYMLGKLHDDLMRPGFEPAAGFDFYRVAAGASYEFADAMLAARKGGTDGR